MIIWQAGKKRQVVGTMRNGIDFQCQPTEYNGARFISINGSAYRVVWSHEIIRNGGLVEGTLLITADNQFFTPVGYSINEN